MHWKHFFIVGLGESVLGEEVDEEVTGEATREVTEEVFEVVAKGVATAVDEDRTEGWSSDG